MPDTVSDIVSLAEQRAADLPAPQPKMEAWRYVDVKPLTQERQGEAQQPRPLPAGLEGLRPLTLSAVDDGALLAWRKAVESARDSSDVWSWTQLQRSGLAELQGSNAEPFLLRTQGSGGQRYLIRLDAGAMADLVIVHDVPADQRAVIAIEVDAGPGSVLRIDEIELPTEGQLLVQKRIQAAGDATVTWNAFSSGGELVRHDWYARCCDPHAAINLGGATVIAGDHQAHHYVRVQHAAESTDTTQLFKAVAKDRSRSSFDGLIIIDSGCDGSDAGQTSANLSLSNQARMHARPQLDVHTDDVTAGHGATIGRPDFDEVRYLRSRGLSEAQAQALLVRSFAQEVTHACHQPAIREWCSQRIADILSD